MGLGPYPEVSLAEARELALAARRKIHDGVDPIAAKPRLAPARFRDLALALIDSKRSGWKNAKHAAQWTSTLEKYAFPVLGDRDIRTIETADIMAALTPIWSQKPETASRVRQRIEAVLDYARVIGARTGDNPARWRGHLDHLLPKPASVRQVKHFAALDYRELPDFMTALRIREGVAARALEFAVLTAARSGEVRGARWSEIDDGVWIIPAERTKARKEHRIPVSTAAAATLGAPGDPDTLIFPSPNNTAKPLSDMTLTAVLKRMGHAVTVHGFRSTFRDWAGETSVFPREVIEAALAHRLKDKAEAAYARGDLFQKRKALMQAWADYAGD
jgi:integrase